jgi:two-component system NtrC family response regulator
LQVKLLRFLQEREIERVGGREPIEVDVRIIAATNRNLEVEIDNGNFRADLFYRLSVISVRLPPLHERGQDILILADHFMNQFKAQYNNSIKGFSAESKNLIKGYNWPGNVRELENKIKRAVIMARGVLIEPHDLSIKFESLPKGRTLKEMVESVEENYIRDALYRNSGNISRTAEELGVNRTTFYDLLNKYSIDKTEFNKKNSQ